MVASRRPQLLLRAALVALVCLAFALKALVLIDATTLWSDELYSVGKSFQPSFPDLLAMLREDTHPPLYYSLLWLWGLGFGQSAVQLRLLSWLAYACGGLVMVAQTWALAPRGRRGVAVSVVALLAWCSPYPVRFAIEGKGYALLVLLVAVGWWLRRRCLPVDPEARTSSGLELWPYALVIGAAGLTHFYGLFVFAAAAAWDGWKRRWRLAITALIGVLPACGWITYASRYLLSSRSGSWIGSPDFALLEETLARALGPWPLPKLALVLVVVVLLRRWGLRATTPETSTGDEPAVIQLRDGSGLMPSVWMVVGVVVVSYVKPLAFSRYFVVLLPALLPWMGVRLSLLRLQPVAQRLLVVLVALTMALWWQQSFLGLEGDGRGARESDQFRAISQITATVTDRFSPRPRLLNLSDRMELAAGRIPQQPAPWGDADALEKRLGQSPLPSELWLAASGPDEVSRRRLRPLERQALRRGYRCEEHAAQPQFSKLVRCQWSSTDAAPPAGVVLRRGD